jgi:PAS domain S-box-containing protein
MDSGSRIRALSVSFTLCLFLCTIAFVALRYFSIPAAYVKDAFYISVFLVIALITAVVHQSLLISMSARALAKHMTKDMLIYSREFFSELYRGSPVPYMVTDDDGLIESINLAAARFFDVAQDALDGKNVYDFFVEDTEHQGSTNIALIPEYFKRGKYVNEVELQMRLPSGVTRWVMFSLFPCTDAQGSPKGMLTLIDITKQKQVDKAKTEFVSLASHQLRTPISGMKWNIELLEGSGGLSEAQTAYITKIKRSAERMDSLVTDFLSVSKLDLGTFVPEYASVEMAAFFSGVADEYAALIEQKSITMKTSWPKNGETLRTDTHLLQMITSNLLGNAVKYTNEGGTVGFSVTDMDDRISIAIADTGIGIPLADQEMLFSKLYRASNARSLVTDGTGLGLYIVKEAIRILGGTISFVSKEGEGSTFTVVLPKNAG